MTPVETAHRPGPASWLRLIRCEATMVARDTAGLIIPLVLPLLILVMSTGSLNDVAGIDKGTALGRFVLPIVFAMIIAVIGVVNMPSFLATYRKTGVLRRLAVTPASPVMVLVAQVVVGLLQTLVGLVLALGVALIFLDAGVPERPGIAIGVLLLAIVSMYALGMVIAAVAPSPNAALALGLIAFFALGALGGMFGGQESLPGALAEIGRWLPFGAAVDALSSAWAGEAIAGRSMIGLAGPAVAGVAVATWLFRWE